MANLYRWISGIWAFFILLTSGFAGGPRISTPLPWVEIIGFCILALFYISHKNKSYGYLLIVFIFIWILYSAYFKLQSPYWAWSDIQNRYQIPIGILLFSAFSIWKLRPEKNNDLDEGVEVKKE